MGRSSAAHCARPREEWITAEENVRRLEPCCRTRARDFREHAHSGSRPRRHLRDLELQPEEGFTFSAVPVKVRVFGTFPVRAFAAVLNAGSKRVARALSPAASVLVPTLVFGLQTWVGKSDERPLAGTSLAAEAGGSQPGAGSPISGGPRR